MHSRFTIDGSDALEQLLQAACEEAAQKLQPIFPPGKLQLLLLGGGYGRGEGGVMKQGGADHPYNDLEFYLFVRGNRLLNQRRYGSAVHCLGEELTKKLGIEVEFKLASLEEFRAAPVSMFSYDLLQGHKTFFGNENEIAGCDQHLAARRIPLHECARLLMNRCSGLLFAQERLQRREFGPAESDFTRRNIAKAQLALGDTLLAALGQYHWSCRERDKRLQKLESLPGLPVFEQIAAIHKTGVDFKLHPFQSNEPREILAAEHAAIKAAAESLWLWLESKRLKHPFSSSVEYAFHRAAKCPEVSKTKSAVINLTRFGARTLLGSNRFCYPRERLLRTLPLLLWGDFRIPKALHVAFAQKQLRTSAASFAGLVDAYEAIWRQYN
jgi:hypothetical protein